MDFEQKIEVLKHNHKRTFIVTPREIANYFEYKHRSENLSERVNKFLDENGLELGGDFYESGLYTELTLRHKYVEPKKVQINSRTKINGTKYIRDHTFASGHKACIFEAETYHGLTQLLGKVKFVNKEYGLVMYRGECKLHDNVLPSLFRGRSNVANAVAAMNTIKNKIIKDAKLCNFIKLSENAENHNDQLEGLLQHYGVKTRYIDVVDNHWVAIWMGLNECQEYNLGNKYYRYCKREIPVADLLNQMICKKTSDAEIDTKADSEKETAEKKTKSQVEEEYYQYILLIALPYPSEYENGIRTHKNYKIIDLRQAVPSVFLRPHAQHGIVVRKAGKGNDKVEDYDFANDVVCIIRIRIDRANQWLGDGQLMTQEALFPAPAFDNGYDILLQRKDIFENSSFQISHYI